MVAWIREILALAARRPGSPQNLATEQFVKRLFRELVEAIDLITASRLDVGLKYGRDDVPPPLPRWFQRPPQAGAEPTT